MIRENFIFWVVDPIKDIFARRRYEKEKLAKAQKPCERVHLADLVETNTLTIELNPDTGEVAGLWYGCISLPYETWYRV